MILTHVRFEIQVLNEDKLPPTCGFLLCWLKNIYLSSYRLSTAVQAERIKSSNRMKHQLH